ncbi:hypothetical protein HYFRA_00013425 [Hymenoscyphus fraxineus]|uniref:Centromere protein Cenp-K n=1 Tax=Hymenoscyphus fraxineus TaxID=746836 RepID=A0A9N9L8T8_9HELO|nr:hypothetical protein HYFRA_00013425 [Hymenoscyphus fraxineus]
MSSPQKARAASSYTTRLDKTLRTLQERVKEQEAILEELRASTVPLDTVTSEHPKSHLLQLRALKTAYETLTPQEPWLPSPDSPVPALLALRDTDKCIKETRQCISQSEIELQEAQARLEKEQGFHSDAKIIQNELKSRIASLQTEIDEKTQKTSSQIAKDMIREMQSKQEYYDTETGKLVQAFNQFIDDHLAPLLAAEELGGPIVGDNLSVDEVMLEAGFTAKGKAKKPKAKPDVDKRQRRIDQIWGKRVDPDEIEDDEPWDEKRAAGAEMRELTEQLLNNLVEAGGTGPGAYVEIERESAAARFLVRSKVAQFHPKDARRIRLVDFGGEVED